MPDPVVTEVTNVTRTLMLRLRASSNITALTANRIAIERPQDDWPIGQPAIMIREVGGSYFEDFRHQLPRFDVWCLAGTGAQSRILLNRVTAWLCPHPSDRARSFKIENCVVFDVRRDGGVSTRPRTKDEPWYALIQAFILHASEVPL